MNEYKSLPNFDEASSSQIPALLQLVNLGYSYISRAEMKSLRENKGQYILRSIALESIRKINGENVSDKSIQEAIVALEQVKMDEGIIKVSEDIFSDLLGGKAVSEIIEGKRISPQLRFIDWKNPENNSFHVTSEFEIEEDTNRRPDIILFVNGIPLVVIENKKPSVPVKQAIEQMLRNQSGKQTPRFFLYPQILLCSNVIKATYGTMQTPKNFYGVWKEKNVSESFEKEILSSLNKKVPAKTLEIIAKDLLRSTYQQHERQEPTEQDKAIYSLLCKERLLDIIRNFIIYDNGIKKIARYQQYFVIKKTLKTIENKDDLGKRQGGVIWHTQGSGKSLTMVMLVKNLIENVQQARILVVSDRTDLDIQIRNTFEACNIKVGVQQAKSKEDLIKKITSKTQDVITTLVHKFDKASTFEDDDNNIFIFIDEAHRTQGGIANAEMNRFLPRACQIGFTGTPLMKGDKSFKKFGGLLDSYTISEAEADGAILPLIYQGRFSEQNVNEMMDLFYEQITRELPEAQRKELEKRYLSKSITEETVSRIEAIAYDIHKHFRENFQGTGLKGQIVAPSKYAAVCFKEALDALKGIKTEVIISESQIGESEEDKENQYKKVIQNFMQEEKYTYGSMESREKKIIEDYKKNPEGCEIIIVVDKLLTGFDAPCNTVLYLARQLKEHNLFQAIARVNRVYEGESTKQSKTAGLIIDYSKNAKNLKDAMGLFSNYDKKDIERALLNTNEQIYLLESIYHTLHGLLASVKDKQNTGAYIKIFSEDENKKNQYYEGVNNFIRVFSTCLSLYDFNQKFSNEKFKRYTKDLKRFVEIKKATQISLAENVDFGKYRAQLHKLLDRYISADAVQILSQEINLSDIGAFNRYIEDEGNGLSKKSQAIAIGAQVKKIISERYKQDEVFYNKFSDKVKELLKQISIAKQEDIASLFDEMKDIQEKVVEYKDTDIPEKWVNKKFLHPFYRNILELLDGKVEKSLIPALIEHMVGIIVSHKVIDWEHSLRIQNKVLIEIEDFLLDDLEGDFRDNAQEIATLCWNIAINNKESL